jgi:hypothetical protein
LITGLEQGSNSRIIYPDKSTLDEMRNYSRFPKGLPPGLDPEILRLKKE